MFFFKNKLQPCVIPHFHGIFTVESIYNIILMIQGHLEGQISRSCRRKYDFSTNNAMSMCNNSFQWDF